MVTKVTCPYPTMHHIGTEMFTFLFQCGLLWDMGQVHCGICQIDWYHHSTPTCSAVTIIVTTWLPGWRVNHLTYKKKVLKQIFMTNMQNIYIKNKLRCILYGAIDLLKQIFMINVQIIYKKNKLRCIPYGAIDVDSTNFQVCAWYQAINHYIFDLEYIYIYTYIY